MECVDNGEHNMAGHGGTDTASLVQVLKQLDNTLRQQMQLANRRRTSSTSKQKIRDDVEKPAEFCKTEKTTVYVRVEFLKIGEIDTLKEKYCADLFIQARWREPLYDNRKDIDAEEINWDAEWTPKIYIENALDEVKESVWYTITHDAHGGAFVNEKRRVKGTFLENLELVQFPFDTQDLTVTVTSERSVVELALQEDTSHLSSINVHSFVDEQEWRLHTHVETTKRVATLAYNNPRAKYPALSAACQASRRPGFFIWNIILVMVFICSLAFATFSVDIKLPQNRLQLSFILVLTCITFKFVVNQNLPRISYLTYLDKYILTSMAILCLVCVWHSVIARVEQYNLPLALEMDQYALIVLAVFYITFQIGFFGWIFWVTKSNLLRLSRKDKEHTERMTKAKQVDPHGKRKIPNRNGNQNATKVHVIEHPVSYLA